MTAENLQKKGYPQGGPQSASMRPRPMTAENRVPDAGRPDKGRRFNEAAADDRGKPSSWVILQSIWPPLLQ